MNKPTRAWSYSALTSYEQCPKRYWHISVKKDVTEVAGPAVAYGRDVHSAIENHLKKGTELPLGMRHIGKLLVPLNAMGVTPIVEQKLALDLSMTPCGWFGDGVWVRVVVDAAYIAKDRALLCDWKTGKRKEDDDQLALMAAVMFAHMPELSTVDSAFFWLQEPVESAVVSSTFERKDVSRIWDRFLRRVNAFQEAHRNADFPALPNGLCRKYCPVKQCAYNGAA